MSRYKYNLSNYKLLTAEMGRLYPINLCEVLPGDTVQQHSNVLIRVSPMAAPVMHPVTARVHHFFVPHRLTYPGDGGLNSKGWEEFITGGPDGNDASLLPQYTTIDYTTGLPAGAQSLQDYLNIPPIPSVNINRMPFEAYNLIWNEFYRDQDLQAEIATDQALIQNIAWNKDYFTTARPFAQKGSDVTIPLGDLAPVTGIGKDALNGGWRQGTQPIRETGGDTNYTEFAKLNSDQPDDSFFVERQGNTAFPAIYADLAQATGANINDVRRAFAIQRYQEARSRYGSRYVEYLRYLGVKNPSDARLQRPEFLAGGSAQLNFSEVVQTAPETGQEPSTEFGVGDMYGHGIAAMRSNKYRRYFEEHGYILSLLSVRPTSIYQDGIERHFLRRTKEDFYQKELVHIGQQEIYNNEVYAQDEPAGYETFGYTDRYDEYRSARSNVAGEFRDTLDYWHMARKFQTPPVLNEDFVKCEPTKRIYNEQTTNPLWIMVQNKVIARRMLTNNASGRVI